MSFIINGEEKTRKNGVLSRVELNIKRKRSKSISSLWIRQNRNERNSKCIKRTRNKYTTAYISTLLSKS